MIKIKIRKTEKNGFYFLSGREEVKVCVDNPLLCIIRSFWLWMTLLKMLSFLEILLQGWVTFRFESGKKNIWSNLGDFGKGRQLISVCEKQMPHQRVNDNNERNLSSFIKDCWAAITESANATNNTYRNHHQLLIYAL